MELRQKKLWAKSVFVHNKAGHHRRKDLDYVGYPTCYKLWTFSLQDILKFVYWVIQDLLLLLVIIVENNIIQVIQEAPSQASQPICCTNPVQTVHKMSNLHQPLADIQQPPPWILVWRLISSVIRLYIGMTCFDKLLFF